MDFKFPNKIVKFRFFVKDPVCRQKLSKFLSLVDKKYTPSVYYIKQLDDIRKVIDSTDEFSAVSLLEEKKNVFSDLYNEFLALTEYWSDFCSDLKAYILIAFQIEYKDLLTEN